MPSVPKIDKNRMMQLVNEGKTNPEIAKYFNCSVYAVEHSRKAMKKKAQNLPALGSGAGDKNIDSMKQLVEINQTIIEELKRCNKFVLREEKKMNEFDAVAAELELDPDNKELKAKLDGLTDNISGIMRLQNNIINISGEIRKQIELQLKIAETLYNVQMNQEFQHEVIETIKELDPKAAAKIINRLRERRALRGLVKG